MKKGIPALLLASALLLSGCSVLNREYTSVRPHTSSYYESADRSVLRAESYQDLVNDLLLLIGSQETDGTIWLYPTEGETLNAAEAAEQACQEVKQETPMGAYAVDYMTYDIDDSSRNYSQITLTISYRRTPEQMGGIVHTTSVAALYDLLSDAVAAGQSELVIQVGYFDHQKNDVYSTVKRVRTENGISDDEEWQVNFYPTQNNAGIIEILMQPQSDAQQN
ncbi:MAG: hypothetical protein KBS74_02485 [Clostridiales bacterium]|nr:hypothetical protein [Candidatus Cacconaster stercorequi]